MRTYYLDAEIYISSSAIWFDERRYPLNGVEGVWRRSRGLPGGRLIGQLAVLIAVGALAVLGFGLGIRGHVSSGTLARLFGSTTGLVVVGLVGLGVSVAVVLVIEAALHGMESARRFGRQQELWVRYLGTDLLVLSTSDSVRLGKVHRAVIRALGDRQP
jgi:hypothetical protein